MKPIDIILILIIGAAVAAALVKTVRSFKSGACCGDCSKCGGCCERESDPHDR